MSQYTIVIEMQKKLRVIMALRLQSLEAPALEHTRYFSRFNDVMEVENRVLTIPEHFQEHTFWALSRSYTNEVCYVRCLLL